jgi:thioredoxin-dependent peroxiredoxin
MATAKSPKKASTKAQPAKKPVKKAAAKPRPKPGGQAAGPGPARAPASVEGPSVTIGGKAPAFSLPDGNGKLVRSSALAGKPYVLYFYPKDNTPGCTQEACDFRDQYAALLRHGVQVLGVSPDSSPSHHGFSGKFNLPFPLLSDQDKELATAYGVWAMKKNYGREFMGIVRSTFLVDARGKIRAAWRGVRVPGHVEAVLEEVKKVSHA